MNVFDEAAEVIRRDGWKSFADGFGPVADGKICVGMALETVRNRGTAEEYKILVDTTGDSCDFYTFHNDYHVTSEDEALAWLARASRMWEERRAANSA